MSKRIRISFDWSRHLIPIEYLEYLLVEGILYDKKSAHDKSDQLHDKSILDE